MVPIASRCVHQKRTQKYTQPTIATCFLIRYQKQILEKRQTLQQTMLAKLSLHE